MGGHVDLESLRTDGPVAVRTVAWATSTDEPTCTVVAKATYTLAAGTCPVADPLPPLDQDAHWFDDPRRSVRTPAECAPFKAIAEVTLSGSAFAAGGREVSRVVARLVVASVDKSIEAWAQRRFSSEGALVTGAAQAVFPLAWEFAAGGSETDNPVGVECNLDGAVPSLQPAGYSLGHPSDYVPGISFAPIAARWPSRRRLLHPSHAAWALGGLAGSQPHGFDAAWFQAAPRDQRIDSPFAADIRLVLEGMHHEHPRLVTNLPGLEPRLWVWTPLPRAVRMIADSLHIDTDEMRVTMVWRAAFPLHRGILATVSMRRAGEPVAADEVQRLRGLHGTSVARTSDEASDRTAADPGMAAGPALPFPAGIAGARLPAEIEDRTPMQPPLKPPPTAAQAPMPAASPLAASGPIAASPPHRVAAPSHPGAVEAPVPVFREPLPPARMAPVVNAPTQGPSAQPAAKATRGDAPPAGGRASSATQGTERGAGFSAREASDAAADRSPWAARRRPAVATDGEAPRRALVDLLHLDPDLAARLLRDPALQDEVAATGAPALRRTSDAAAKDDTADRDRARVVRFLSCATPTEGHELREVMQRRLAARVFELPLLLVEAELRPSFDELEVLRATIAVARPLASGDKRIAPIIQHAAEQLDAPAPPSGEVALALVRQIEQATQQLSLPPRWVEKSVERSLLDRRRFRRRDVFGGPMLRCELALPAPHQHLPTYVAEAAAPRLPLLSSFPAILLGELRPREDGAETEREAFLALAVGRRLDARTAPERE